MAEKLIHLPTEDARGAKWQWGRERYGPVFIRHRLEDLDEGTLGRHEARRRSRKAPSSDGKITEDLRPLCERLRAIYRAGAGTPEVTPREASANHPAGRGFDGAAVFQCQLIEVQFDAVFNDAPFGAGLMLCDGTKASLCVGAQGEQLARIIPDTFRFTLLAESFRWTSPSLLRRLHRLIMSYHKGVDLCYHKCYCLSMKAIGYIRVSTEKQADFGVSLEAQAEKVRAMAVVQGAELSEVIVDAGESAKSLNRPGMGRLFELVDARAVDVVIIAKLDRLTRSVADLAELLKRFERRGVSLVSVADSLDTRSAAGRLVLNIMVSVSQWEREAIGERTRDAMHHKRVNGERVGTVPFGYRMAPDALHLETDPVEQGILSRIRELKAAGYTTRQIADELNRQGFTTRRGTAWRFQYVAVALRAA